MRIYVITNGSCSDDFHFSPSFLLTSGVTETMLRKYHRIVRHYKTGAVAAVLAGNSSAARTLLVKKYSDVSWRFNVKSKILFSFWISPNDRHRKPGILYCSLGD